MALAKKKLWEALDVHGYEFRLTCSALIDKYGGVPSGWSDSLRHCELGCTAPLIDGLAHPICFQFSAGDILNVPPASLFGYVRLYDDEYQNFDHTHAALTKLFGDGEESSVSNTKGRTWNFEDASIDITVFPRDRDFNMSSNSRHEAIKGSETECSLSIYPAYYVSLSETEAAALATYEQFKSAEVPPSYQRPYHHAEILRRAPGAKGEGFGFDRGKTYLIQMLGGDQVNIVPLAQIISVTHFSIKPAKGGGGIYLSVEYRSIDKRVTREPSLTLVYDVYKEGAYMELAEALAKALGVPLNKHEDYDV